MAGSPEHPHLLLHGGERGGRDLPAGSRPPGRSAIRQATAARAGFPALSLILFSARRGAFQWLRPTLGPERAPLSAFPVANGSLGTPLVQAAKPLGFLGVVPSASANGGASGRHCLGDLERLAAPQAYDAASLEPTSGDSQSQPADIFGGYAEFTTPTVAGSRVYIGGSLELEVYGELVADPPVVTAITERCQFPERSPGAGVAHRVIRYPPGPHHGGPPAGAAPARAGGCFRRHQWAGSSAIVRFADSDQRGRCLPGSRRARPRPGPHWRERLRRP